MVRWQPWSDSVVYYLVVVINLYALQVFTLCSTVTGHIEAIKCYMSSEDVQCQSSKIYVVIYMHQSKQAHSSR